MNTFVVTYRTLVGTGDCAMTVDAVNAEDAVKACTAAHPSAEITGVRAVEGRRSSLNNPSAFDASPRMTMSSSVSAQHDGKRFCGMCDGVSF